MGETCASPPYTTRRLTWVAGAIFAISLPFLSQADGVDARLAEGSGYRIIRFVALASGQIPPPDTDGHYRPRGELRLENGSDPALGRQPARYSTMTTDVSGTSGEFVDTGSIHFAGGELKFAAAAPTHNEPTPIPGVRMTALVEKITGGAGAFSEATGYLQMSVTLEASKETEHRFHGVMTGFIIVKTPSPSDRSR